MEEQQKYENIIRRINKELDKAKEVKAKSKSNKRNNYVNKDKDKYNISIDLITTDCSSYQSLSYLSGDDSSDTEKYIDIRNKNHNYKKSIEKKKNEIDLLNKKMDILKQKIKLREERQKAINSKLNKTKNKINDKETHHRHQSNITATTDTTNLTDNLTNNISQSENIKLKKTNQYKTSNASSSVISSQKDDNGHLHHHRHHRKVSHKKYIIDNGVGLTEEDSSFISTPKSKLASDTNTLFIKKNLVTPTKKNNNHKLDSATIKNKNTISQKEEVYWLQQKFVDLQEIIEEKDSRLLEKDKIIAELNEKIHETEQMKDEMA